MAPKLLHIDPDQFLVDSFRLGREIYLSGFRPKHAISIWRGGTPVGLGVDAFFRSRGVLVSHTTIGTASYVGIAQQVEDVMVKNLEHLVQVVCPEDSLLIIDDVYESGNTIRKVVELLRAKARANAPREIVVAAVHIKPEKVAYSELPVITLERVASDVWIDYPHELADLTDAADPDDSLIRQKGEDLWRILREEPSQPVELDVPGPYYYASARELHLDCLRLGVAIAHDSSFRPDYLIALWPGGVIPGLAVHEVYKYFLKRSGGGHAPDHISLNTSPTRVSYRHQVIGIQYLEDRITKDDNILIIDATFRAGRLVNDVVQRLKEALRRNLNHKRVRVASVYYNPDDTSTWTVRPDIKRPDYFLKTIRKEVIYPASVHKLPNAHRDLRALNPALWQVLYGD
jgi:hypoxanthine phosphoribosyltransferase